MTLFADSQGCHCINGQVCMCDMISRFDLKKLFHHFHNFVPTMCTPLDFRHEQLQFQPLFDRRQHHHHRATRTDGPTDGRTEDALQLTSQERRRGGAIAFVTITMSKLSERRGFLLPPTFDDDRDHDRDRPINPAKVFHRWPSLKVNK